MAGKSAYACADVVEEHLHHWFAAQRRDKGFGYARLARNLFEAVVAPPSGPRSWPPTA